MKRKMAAVSWLAIGGLLAGCSAGDNQQPAGSTAVKASATSRPPQLPPAPAPSLPAGSERAVATTQPAIRLSTGVALPQTGPTGILMSFSVEYQFTRGGPHPGAQLFWVIVPEKGKSWKQPVRLESQGTLEILVPGWRPEMGPFQTHLEDRNGRKLSTSLPLQ